MRRRRFVTLNAAAFAVAPAVMAQSRRVRVAVLGSDPWQPIAGLEDGLKQAVRSPQQVSVEFAWFHGDPQRLRAVADELIKSAPDVIVTVGTPAILAAKQRTMTIPLVMGLIGDPVESGIIQSLSRPGGNITGVSVLAAELEPKRLQLLKQIVPKFSRCAVLLNAANPYSTNAMKYARSAEKGLDLVIEPAEVRRAADIEPVLASLQTSKPDGVLVIADQMLLGARDRIAKAFLEQRLPSAFTYQDHVEAGGLLAYSTNYYEAFREASGYVVRILGGASPSGLPVKQVERFELVVNMTTVRTLGLTIPDTVRALIDRSLQ